MLIRAVVVRIIKRTNTCTNISGGKLTSPTIKQYLSKYQRIQLANSYPEPWPIFSYRTFFFLFPRARKFPWEVSAPPPFLRLKSLVLGEEIKETPTLSLCHKENRLIWVISLLTYVMTCNLCWLKVTRTDWLKDYAVRFKTADETHCVKGCLVRVRA